MDSPPTAPALRPAVTGHCTFCPGSILNKTRDRRSGAVPGGAIQPRAAFGAHSATAATVADESCTTMALAPGVRWLLEENDGPSIKPAVMVDLMAMKSWPLLR